MQGPTAWRSDVAGGLRSQQGRTTRVAASPRRTRRPAAARPRQQTPFAPGRRPTPDAPRGQQARTHGAAGRAPAQGSPTMCSQPAAHTPQGAWSETAGHRARRARPPRRPSPCHAQDTATASAAAAKPRPGAPSLARRAVNCTWRGGPVSRRESAAGETSAARRPTQARSRSQQGAPDRRVGRAPATRRTRRSSLALTPPVVPK
jgi:hypothetical protein